MLQHRGAHFYVGEIARFFPFSKAFPPGHRCTRRLLDARSNARIHRDGYYWSASLLKSTPAGIVLIDMPKPPRSRLARRPLTDDQQIAHFKGAESLMNQAVDSAREMLDSGEEMEVWLRSPNPTTREDDEWKFLLCCLPMLDVDHVEFGAQYSISLLVEARETFHQGEDAWELVCEESREAHVHDREFPLVTCAFATWLLRLGWIFVGDKLTATEAVDGEYYIAEGGRLGFEQTVRTRGKPPIEPPHWKRANELRKAWRDREPKKLSGPDEWKEYQEYYRDEEPWF